MNLNQESLKFSHLCKSVVPPAAAPPLGTERGSVALAPDVLLAGGDNGIPLSHLHAVSSLSPFGCKSFIPVAITPSNGASIPVELVWKIIILMPLPPPRGASAGLLNCIIS
jgi:hypothetical protein